MANYLAGLYEQRGGDDKLQERYAQLVQWASEDGVLDQARKKSIPERLGGAFARLTEFFQREEFAVAGVWDVLGGTADEGETVGGRVVREMLGGTKLGNLVGVPDVRAQEAFTDVMEQRGVGEGGRLSDLIGDNWVTKYFDPTVRGTAGLGMSILFTPSTYVTFGAGGAAKWVGRGGDVIRASDEAIKLGETVYKAKIDRVAKRLGLADDIAEVAAGNKNWYDLESTVISRMTRQSNHKGLNAYNEMLIRERVRRSAEETVVRMARTRPELTENVAMRFAGIKVADLEPLGRYGGVVWDSLRNKRITAPLIGGIDEAARGLDKLFQRVPFGARKHEAFRRAEARRHAMRQSASQQANELIFGRSGFMSKQASKALFGDDEANKALARFLDTGVDPPVRPAALAEGASAEEVAAFQKAMADYELASEGFEAARNQWVENAARIGIDEDEALGVAGGWADLADGLGISAVSDQLIGEDAYLRFKRRYLPRNLKEEFSNRVGKEARFSFNGGDVGQYALMREYDTLDEFVERVRVLGLDPDEAIEWNVQKLMHDYVTRHIRATADANLARETVSLLSPSFQTVFKELSKDLVAFKAEPSGKELEMVNDLLSRSAKEFGADDIAAIRAMRPELRAAYLYEELSKAQSLSDVDSFFRTFDKVIGDIPHSVMADLRRAGGSRQFAGLREHTFKSGPLRGQRAMVPAGIKEFFDADVKGMQSRLPEEAGKLLKMFDFFQNTFKRTHTALFPSFHVRNAVSNAVAMSVETNIMELAAPDVTQSVIKLLTNYGDDFTMVASNGRRYTRQELRNLLVSLDVIPERMQVEELTGNSDELLKRIKGLRKIDEAAGAVGSGIENYARASYFIGQLKRGVHPMDAAMNVKRVLFDYSDLSFTQREIIRRLFPFATWTMKNVELQVKNLLTRPGRTGAVIRVANAGEMGPEADLLPEYMRGEMKVKLSDQPGKAGTFLTGIDLPINNVDILWAGGVGKTMREQFGMFTPIIKAPMEYMLNLDTFTGQPIRGRRWLGQMGPVIERTWPKTMRDWIELQKIETADGRTLYKANGTKMWLISKNIFLGRMFNESVNAVGMAEEIANGDVDQGMKSLMRVLSGMRFTEMNLSDAQKEKLRREVRAIEEYLVERGGLAEYRSAYRPKYMQQQQQPFGILGAYGNEQRR